MTDEGGPPRLAEDQVADNFAGVGNHPCCSIAEKGGFETSGNVPVQRPGRTDSSIGPQRTPGPTHPVEVSDRPAMDILGPSLAPCRAGGREGGGSAMAKSLETKDLIMLLLYAKGHMGKDQEPIRGRTRFVKMVFLFKKEMAKQFKKGLKISESDLPKFEPYHFGPFSPQVYQDLEFLVDNGFVKAKATGSNPVEEEVAEYQYWQMSSAGEEDDAPLVEEEYSLTPLGISFVEDGEAGRLSKDQQESLDKFKARCTGASLRQLLKYVYTKYPETAAKSKIANDII